MFTLPTHHGEANHHRSTTKHSPDDHTGKDVWTGVLFIALLIAIMGLVLWMASVVEPVHVEPDDFWYLMP